ncbi:hypothetical protein GALL_55470 [mine drainage metagenome]|uniref:Sialate O-acetylesterase domain-containing protein n=1 Tax=mine drainage metagenome TaxID=410659 RepID=A0A1J5SX64_9ZZZZ
MKKLFAFVFTVIISMNVFANVSLPKIFADDMVLQRNKPIRIWGTASASEKISVQFNKQIKNTKADKSGNWFLFLDEENAGGPFQLIVIGENKITFNNILVGEVWICSGQSNMELQLAGWTKVDHSDEEIKAANYPQIRQFEVPKTISTNLKNDLSDGAWKVCNPATAGNFSAVAYFFAKELYKQLKVPIGIINSTMGGTQIESWISKNAFKKNNEFKKIADSLNKFSIQTIKKFREESVMKKVAAIRGASFTVSEINNWKNFDYNDSKWLSMKEPAEWGEEGFRYFGGIAWIRKTINIDEADAGKIATLELSKIADGDETFVNGIKVGSNHNWNDFRKYSVPAGILKAGRNVIAIRIFDDGGSSGLYGDEDDLKLTIGNKIISLAGNWLLNIESVSKSDSLVRKNDLPGLLFNAMINPLINYSICGVIWYQGETNESRAYQYRKTLPLLINDWRQHFDQENFPFLFVQLPSYCANHGNSNKGSWWAELRESQTKTLALPNTGMAVTIDVGETKNLHPSNKLDVGKRLAAVALHDVYKMDGEYTAPQFQSMKIEGNKIILSFNHHQNGWLVKDKFARIKGFEIAGNDQHFYFANATIDGDKIIVQTEKVLQPVAVRYAWADDVSEANLFNQQMFPVAPFRTDNWKGITDERKYSLIE